MSHARIIDSFSIPDSRPRASALLPNTQHYRVLVEAEKTAVIGSGFVPEYVWLATGERGLSIDSYMSIAK